MKPLNTFLTESINDKGLLKSIFIIGTPAAGKTYTTQHLSGQYPIAVINTDIPTEFLAKKFNITSTADNWFSTFHDKSTKMSREMLKSAVNGVLPLMIDGTSNSVANILQRVGILESIGYDVGCIFVKTNIDEAIARAKKRVADTNREVDENFIRSVYEKSVANAEYIKTKLEHTFYREIDNDTDVIGNAEINKIYGTVQGFYGSALKNPVGISTLASMIQSNQKYLIPNIFTKSQLDRKIEAWWR
jgi:predicted ABC-type ATPase